MNSEIVAVSVPWSIDFSNNLSIRKVWKIDINSRKITLNLANVLEFGKIYLQVEKKLLKTQYTNLCVLGHLITHLGMPYLFLKLKDNNTLGYYFSKDVWNTIKYEVKNATFGIDLQCLGSWPVGCKINRKFEGLPILI